MKKTIFLVSLFLSVSLFAQSNIVTTSDQLAVNYLFNGEWQKSDSLINLKLANDPNSLKYNALKAYNCFYTRYVGADNTFTRDETIRQVKKYSWDAIKFGEEKEENLENNFYLGTAYALLARVNVMEQELWQAYWNASKSENYLEDVIDENPNVADAYFNLGVNEYFPASVITGFQSILAWFGGMYGDKEEGIALMEKTSEGGKLFKNEADYALGLLYSFRENDLSTGYEYWNKLTEKFPSSANFAGQKSRAFLGKLVEEKGVEFLEEEFDNLDSLYNVTNPNVLNILGYTLVNQQKLDDALVVFKVNLKKYPEIANCYDSLAECFMRRGENEDAIKYYKIAFDKLETDTTITDDFRERLREGIRTNLKELGSNLDV